MLPQSPRYVYPGQSHKVVIAPVLHGPSLEKYVTITREAFSLNNAALVCM